MIDGIERLYGLIKLYLDSGESLREFRVKHLFNVRRFGNAKIRHLEQLLHLYFLFNHQTYLYLSHSIPNIACYTYQGIYHVTGLFYTDICNRQLQSRKFEYGSLVLDSDLRSSRENMIQKNAAIKFNSFWLRSWG